MPDPTPPTPIARPRRRVLVWTVFAVVTLVGMPLLALATVMWMAMDNMIRMPDWVRDRIVLQIDQAMEANSFGLGGVGLALREGGYTPELVLQNVTLSDDEGLRAEFSEISTHLDPSGFWRGEFRPREVAVTGATLLVRRTRAGEFDLGLTQSQSQTDSARDLEESMRRLDAMFAHPTFASLEEVTGSGLTLVLEDERGGRTIEARNANMRLGRVGDDVTLAVDGQLIGQQDGRLSVAITRRATLARTDIRFQFQNLATHILADTDPAIGWLSLLDAPLSGSFSTRLSDDGSIGGLAGTLDIGAGTLDVSAGVPGLSFDGIRTYFTFDPMRNRLRFNEVSVRSNRFSVNAVGHADLVDVTLQDAVEGEPNKELAYVGQFQLSGILANPEGMFGEPVSFDGGAVEMRLRLDPLRVDIGQIVLRNEDLNVNAEGTLRGDDTGLSAAINIEIPHINARRLLPYWPLEAIPNTRLWLSENLLQGEINNMTAALRYLPETEPQISFTFDYENADVRPVRLMPPVRGAHGYASMIEQRFVMSLQAGAIEAPDGGEVTVFDTTMIIADTSQRWPDAEFGIGLSGAIPSVLSLLNEPPLNVLRTSGRDPAEIASGQAILQGTLRVPLIENLQVEDVDFDVRGSLSGVRSDTLVQGRVLTATSLDLHVVPDAIDVSGRAALDGIEGTATWSQVMGPEATGVSRVEGVLAITNDNLNQLGVVLPDGFVSGRGVAEFTIDLAVGGGAQLQAVSDLQGLVLAVEPLRWRKPQGTRGLLNLQANLGPDLGIPSLILQANGLQLQGAVSFSDEGQFETLSFSQLSVDDWLNVQGALRSRGPNTPPAIEVSSGRFDLRRLPPSDSVQSDAGGPLTAQLDQLQISDSITLTDVRADLTGQGGLSGQFTGNINGASPIRGTLVTTESGIAVRIRSTDGGAALRAAGVFANGYGGEMDLILQPTEGRGAYSGRLTIQSPRLRNAPAMAELLNAISVVGLLEQLSDTGINLGQVEADFGLTPRAVTLTRGSAVGPSLGISMDGIYDMRERQFEMQGVVSPFYVVNGLFGALFAPRREGLFGFSYRLTGSPEDTNVAVNPLSILTPGIFRDIFRQAPPELPE
jgi:hypothetical protein